MNKKITLHTDGKRALPRLSPEKKKSYPRWRVVAWCFEGVILLACLEHFVFKPALAKREAARAKPVAQALPQGPLAAEPAEPRQLPGLTMVKPAYLAPLEGLAEGSASAQGAQVSVCQSNQLPVEVVNSAGMAFRLIPAGTCLIGSPESEKGRESVENQHVEVFPSHFYMGKTEVTQAQWKAVMGEAKNPSGYLGDDRPVEEITWYDCQRFVLKLCQREELPIGSYRLPTEAEWEYCCRAGTNTAYCFGDSPRLLGNYADYADNNYRHTSPVGRKRPNAFGLYDMHGNVWEWCLNDYKNYPGCDAPETEANKYPVIRGGNWYVEAHLCRSANRSRLPGASHGNMLGFRVLRMVVEPPKVKKPVKLENTQPDALRQ